MPVPPFKLLNTAAETKGNIYDLKVRCAFKTFAAFVTSAVEKCFVNSKLGTG